MINPLYKRIKREFKHDIIKYIIMFLFLALPIALTSGYMVGNDSMIKTYNESIEKYVLEDGHFKLQNKISNNLKDEIEKNENIKIYNLNYKDELSNNSHTIRLYKTEDRLNIDKWCIHEGKLPQNKNEIALDRLYLDNNKLKVGDTIIISNNEFKISASISLFDYSALFKNNTDSMFDANKFSIALVNNEGYNLFSNDNIVYNYAYLLPQRLNKNEAHDKTIKLTQNIYKYATLDGNVFDSLLAKEDNQAIKFTIDDLEGDLAMMLIFGLLIVFGLAFVFALSIKSQIEKEAKSIGTLKAMGYKNTELLSHYLILPTIITLLSAIFGNILAYTFLKEYIVSLYYHSYSLPIY